MQWRRCILCGYFGSNAMQRGRTRQVRQSCHSIRHVCEPHPGRPEQRLGLKSCASWSAMPWKRLGCSPNSSLRWAAMKGLASARSRLSTFWMSLARQTVTSRPVV